MKKLFILTLLMSLVLCIPQIVIGQSSKDAYRSLKKLEAKVQTGISYKDYGPSLGDAKLEVNLFNESAEAKEKPKLKEIFNKTMGHYEEAGNIWSYKFAGRGYPNMVSPDDSAMIHQILRFYPSLRTKIELIEGRERLSYSEALKACWREASEELKKAGSLVK